jgi:uncharacterized MAPEG superfamily protein
METVVTPYHAAMLSYLGLGILFLAQTLVADAAAIRAGHVPGTPVTGGHDDFLFRATRAHANTNENLAAFVALSLAAVFLRADPWWTNALAATFALSRLAHMLTYYLDLRSARSASFVVGLLCLVGLAIATLATIV